MQKRNKQGHEGNVYCTPSSLQVRIKKNKLKKNWSFHALSACSEDKDA